MSENQQQFRSTAFGGFHKQDVLNYIDASVREHTGKVEALQKELEDERAARAALEGEKAALAAELEGLKETLAAQSADAERLSREVEEKNVRLAALEGEQSTLRARLDALEPDAEAFRKVKDRTAGIELEAHCRAEAAEAAAQARVEEARADLERWMEKMRGGYDRLRTDVDATLSHAKGELDRVGKTLNDINGALSQRDEELEKLLSAWRENGHPKAPVPLDVT